MIIFTGKAEKKDGNCAPLDIEVSLATEVAIVNCIILTFNLNAPTAN